MTCCLQSTAQLSALSLQTSHHASSSEPHHGRSGDRRVAKLHDARGSGGVERRPGISSMRRGTNSSTTCLTEETPADGGRERGRASVQLQSTNARTPPKTGEYQRPESKTSQQHTEPAEICKTSTPGSNPGGASTSKFKRERHFRSRWGVPLLLIRDHSSPNPRAIVPRLTRSLGGATHRPRGCTHSASW